MIGHASHEPSQGFNFSFDVTVVSTIADIIINVHIIVNIADRVSKRCRTRTPRVYGQQQFAESVDFIQTMSRTFFLKQAEAPINKAACLFLLFVVTVDAFGFRFGKSVYVVVYLRLLASLRFVLDRLLFILMEFIFTTVKIISGGDHQFQIFI